MDDAGKMRGDLVDQQVGVEVAGQQRSLEEEHRDGPHRRRPAQHRQHHLGEHGLDGEQQERREEGRGGEGPHHRRSVLGELDQERRHPPCGALADAAVVGHSPSSMHHRATGNGGRHRAHCPNPAPAAALPEQLNASTFQDFVARPMLELLVRQGWLIDKRHCPTPQGRRPRAGAWPCELRGFEAPAGLQRSLGACAGPAIHSGGGARLAA